MDCSRRIYTRRQWSNFCREWNEEKKRKLNQICESESFGFGGDGSTDHGCRKGVDGKVDSSQSVVVIDEEAFGLGEASTSKMVGKFVGKKAGVSVEMEKRESNFDYEDHYVSFLEELEKNNGWKKNKKRRRNASSEKKDHGEYTELLIESSDPYLDSTEKVVKEVEKIRNDKGKEKIWSSAGNVSSKDEDVDSDETFTVREEEFALQSIILEQTDKQAEKSSKKEKEKVISADNLSVDSREVYDHERKESGDESCGGLLNKKSSDYDDDYIEFLEEYSAFLAHYREMSENGVERNNGEEDEKRGSDTGNASEKNDYDDCIEFLGEPFALSLDSIEKVEKRVEKNKKKWKGKGKEKLDRSAGNVSLKAEKWVGKNKKEKWNGRGKEKMESTDGNISPKIDDDNDDVVWIMGNELVLQSNLQEKVGKQVEKSKREKEKITLTHGSIIDSGDYHEEKESIDESKGDMLKERHSDDNKKLRSLKNKCNIKDGGNHEGPAYCLRSCSASKCEMTEKKLRNLRNPLPASEDWKSDTSSDEANNNDNCMKNNVHKDKMKVEHPIKRRKSKRGLGDLNFEKILLNFISENEDLTKNNLHLCEENIPGQLPLKFRFDDEDPAPPEKNEWEKEIEGLFMDLQTGLQELKDSLTTQPLVDNDNIISAENHDDSAVCCQKRKHLLILDEQIGLMCKYCSFVHRERKYILPSFANKTRGRQGMKFFDELDPLFTDNLPLGCAAGNHCTSIHGGGTVWDVLPQCTKETMYPHQREGFEFLWRNIAGDIHIENLKKLQSDVGKGCIISHAPGTGKTRLTIVFLQSFLKLFPACHPLIIAPRSMLLTWEDEFRKWEVDIPFHNLNNAMLSGRENSMALIVSNEPRGKESKRILKLYSWAKGSGILGITYRLFERLVRVKENQEDDKVRKILLKVPGLVVLDEGHTPRNDDSLIWKALSKVETPRRIILSGTPFQNNFDELYNTLCLVCPKFSYFTSGSQIKYVRKRNAAKKRWDRLTSSIGKNKNGGIEKLKSIIAPLVHVHKGNILLERLPGLRSTLVYLKPTSLQQKLLCVIPRKKFLEEDNIMTRISVHPSLVKDLPDFSDYRSEVENLELDPDAGVKTEFLFALTRLSDSHGEKVIVFSQYISPLDLIKKQLEFVFDWVEGREVLYMDGDIDVQHRQAYINTFNDPKSEVKVLLASTRACSEGINLVGASRVVLLDVVWNPSVKRQALSRAYRLGQTKIVHVYHLISSTLEAKKYACQAKKDFISELVFCTSDELPCRRDLPVSEDKILEAMVQHPKHQLIFDRLVHDPKESDLIGTFDFVENLS